MDGRDAIGPDERALQLIEFVVEVRELGSDMGPDLPEFIQLRLCDCQLAVDVALRPGQHLLGGVFSLADNLSGLLVRLFAKPGNVSPHLATLCLKINSQCGCRIKLELRLGEDFAGALFSLHSRSVGELLCLSANVICLGGCGVKDSGELSAEPRDIGRDCPGELVETCRSRFQLRL